MKTFTLSLALLLCAVAQLRAAERGSLEGIAAWKDELAAIQTIESESYGFFENFLKNSPDFKPPSGNKN